MLREQEIMSQSSAGHVVTYTGRKYKVTHIHRHQKLNNSKEVNHLANIALERV